MDFPAQQIFSWEILMQLKRTLALPRDKSNLPTNEHQQALLAYYLFLHTHLPFIFVQLKFGISVGRDSILQCVYATSNHTRQLLPPLKWNVLSKNITRIQMYNWAPLCFYHVQQTHWKMLPLKSNTINFLALSEGLMKWISNARPALEYGLHK